MMPKKLQNYVFGNEKKKSIKRMKMLIFGIEIIKIWHFRN